VDAYFPTYHRFTKFDVTRTGSSVAWEMEDESTGGTPTVAGESVIATGPGAYFAYRQSDGKRNPFYLGPITGGAVRTAVYDEKLHRLYAEEDYGNDNAAISAWDYADNGNITFRWKVQGTQGFASAALDAEGDLWFVDPSGLLREYSPEGQLLKTSTQNFGPFDNTPVTQNGYVWVSDGSRTYALNPDTLDAVKSLPGFNGWGNGFRSTGIIFDDGIIVDSGNENAGFSVYFIPEPNSAVTALVAFGALALRRRRPDPAGTE
jgi:hypothetical protein